MKYADIIAWLGDGSAHPGGFEGTVKLLDSILLPPSSKVLEVGCGTGRTACYLADLGHKVTALDQNETMLEKARARARLEGTAVDFALGDVLELPFAAGSFDLIFAESVTVFVDHAAAIAEYARVLKPGGKLMDREMYVKRKNTRLEKTMAGLYGIYSLPLIGEWVDLMKKAGFSQPKVWAGDGGTEALFGQQANQLWPDPHQMLDIGQLTRPEVSQFMEANREFILEYGQELSYAVLIGTK